MIRLRRFADWPLRAKTAVLLALVSLLPIFTLAVIDIRDIRARRFEDETRLLAARAEQLVGELDRFHEGYQRAVVRLAHVPEVGEYLLATGARADLLRPGVTARLLLPGAVDPALRGIGIIDPTGRVSAATETPLVGKGLGLRRYVGDALRGAAVVSDVHVAEPEVGDEPTIAYVSPVVGPGRAVIGLVAFWVRADALWNISRRSNGLAGEGSFAVVVDRLGVRIAHTYDAGALFRPAGALAPDVVAAMVAERRFGARTRALLEDVRPLPEQFDRARAQVLDGGLFRGLEAPNGTLSYGVGRRMTTATWTVFYMVPATWLGDPIARLTRHRIILGALVGCAALLAGAFFAAAILRPIRRLVSATRALAAGDLSPRIEGGDEIGSLASSFNAMAAQLTARDREAQRAHDELERAVEVRTADLRAASRAEREARQALALSEENFRDLYESSPDMCITADLETEAIIECNQTLCDRLGYTKAEVLGQPYFALYQPDYLAARARERASFQETGEFVDVERQLRRKDGSVFEVSLNLRGIRDPAGRLVGARAVWRDISARKQADRDHDFLLRLGELLRSSTDDVAVLAVIAAELAGYLNTSRALFAEVDLAANMVTIHHDHHGPLPSIAGTLSLSSFGAAMTAEARAGGTIVLHDAAADPRTNAAFEASYLPIAVRALVAVPLVRDGTWVAALVASASEPRRWQEREVALVKLVAERVWVWIEHLRLLGWLRDREVKQAVEKTEERFRVLVDGVRDYAIFMLDPQGIVTSWNAGAERLKGYRTDEIVGQSFTVFFTPEQRADGLPARALARARAYERYEEEGWRNRKDGSRFWASVVITAVRDREGGLEGFAEVTRDFTERRRQEDELRAKQAQLTQSLKERESLLQEVHHRVKNNLQVVSSLINMQMDRLEPGTSHDALEECKSRIQAIALIHERLYQAKDYSQVHFAEYASSLARSVFHAGGTRANVALDLAIDDVALAVDRAIPCGLVLNELITNAFKHGFKDGHGGTIRVALARLEPGMLRLSVEDDGIGLPDGFDVRAAPSMGLQLVCTLAEQLDAVLVVGGDHGASFQLTFAERG